MNDYVYLIGVPNGPIKIGYTKNIQQRLQAIRGKHGEHNELLALFASAGKGRVSESFLHSRFQDHQIDGEWFDIALDKALSAIHPEEIYLEPYDLSQGIPLKSPKTVKMIPVTFRFPPALVERYKATGKGWRTRLAHDLTEACKLEMPD